MNVGRWGGGICSTLGDFMHENETDWQEIANISPADLADRVERLPEEGARDLLMRLPPAGIAAVISELETEKAADLLRDLDGTELLETLRLLSANQIADLLPF